MKKKKIQSCANWKLKLFPDFYRKLLTILIFQDSFFYSVMERQEKEKKYPVSSENIHFVSI